MEMTRPEGLATRPEALASRTGADAIPDARGLNLYRADPMADPLFGLYLPRPLFEEIAPRLTATGFKILLDVLLSAGRPLRCW
jgi:hypothetical protein